MISSSSFFLWLYDGDKSERKQNIFNGDEDSDSIRLLRENLPSNSGWISDENSGKCWNVNDAKY